MLLIFEYLYSEKWGNMKSLTLSGMDDINILTLVLDLNENLACKIYNKKSYESTFGLI